MPDTPQEPSFEEIIANGGLEDIDETAEAGAGAAMMADMFRTMAEAVETQDELARLGEVDETGHMMVDIEAEHFQREGDRILLNYPRLEATKLKALLVELRAGQQLRALIETQMTSEDAREMAGVEEILEVLGKDGIDLATIAVVSEGANKPSIGLDEAKAWIRLFQWMGNQADDDGSTQELTILATRLQELCQK